MPLTFGEKIKEARKQKNLTQRQLADLIGAAHNSISDWENNKNKPDPDTIELLCGVLKITPNYLLASMEDDFSPREKGIIKKYRDLDTHGKKMVDFTLNEEWERTTAIEKENALKEKSNLVSISKYTKEGENENNTIEFSEELTPTKDYLIPNAAHDRTDIEVTEEMKESDDKIFDDF